MTIRTREIICIQAYKNGKRVLFIQRVWGGWVIHRDGRAGVVQWDED